VCEGEGVNEPLFLLKRRAPASVPRKRQNGNVAKNRTAFHQASSIGELRASVPSRGHRLAGGGTRDASPVIEQRALFVVHAKQQQMPQREGRRGAGACARIMRSACWRSAAGQRPEIKTRAMRCATLLKRLQNTGVARSLHQGVSCHIAARGNERIVAVFVEKPTQPSVVRSVAGSIGHLHEACRHTTQIHSAGGRCVYNELSPGGGPDCGVYGFPIRARGRLAIGTGFDQAYPGIGIHIDFGPPPRHSEKLATNCR